MAYHQQSDGRRVYFEHYAGAKTPFVLSHGWGMSSTIWVDVIERLLKAGHEVLAVDHRGCGKSDRDFDDVSISALAGDIVDIVAARNLRPVILNGWSLGGAVVVEAADRLGTAAAGLVLTCAASPRYVQADDFPYGGQRADVLGMPDAILANRATFFRGLSEGVCAKDVGQPTIEWMTAMFMEAGPTSIQSLLNLADIDQRAILSNLSIPVLSVVGGKDVVDQPEIGELAGKLAPKGQVARFDECGHAPFLEEGPLYVEKLLAFAGAL